VQKHTSNAQAFSGEQYLGEGRTEGTVLKG